MIRLRLIIVFTWVFMLARVSRAETSVVIVVPHPGNNEAHAFEHRLRSELFAAGFQPISVEVTTEITPQAIRNAAVRLMSHAAVTLTVHDGIVSGLVWIEGRGKSEDSWRPVAEYPVSEQAPGVFAVRATDVLHGGLLELGYVGTAPSAAEPPAVAMPPSSEREPPAKSNPANPKTPGKGAPKTAEERSDTRGGGAMPKTSLGAPAKSTQRVMDRLPWHFNVSATLAEHVLNFPTSIGLTAMATRRIHDEWNLGAALAYFAPVTASADAGRANIAQAYLGPRLEWYKPIGNDVNAFGYGETGIHSTWLWSEAN
ncbi:MAG TPA: hypothetical protein VIV60_10850, partial [Polyangiaceae bacterium]